MIKRGFIKSTAVFVSFVFLCTNILSASPINTHTIILPQDPDLTPLQEGIKTLFIPECYGSIVKRWKPASSGSNRFIILIQDAHCHYEAQHNIAKILEILVRDYKIDLIGVEGAVGDLDLSRFGKLGNTKTKEKATDMFVKRGIVSGPEYLRITKYNEVPFGLYGIEDGQLYVKNFISFRESMSNSKETQYFMDELSGVISRLKEKIYSKELLEFDNKIHSYNNNETLLTDYIKELYRRRDVERMEYPHLCRVYRCIRLEEGIDFKKVESERGRLIRDIEKRLPKEELEGFVKKSLLFKLGKVSSVEYYSFLEKYLNQSSQSNLRRYIHLTKLQAKIDSNGLFRDIQVIEDKIKEELFRNNTERLLNNLSKKVDILNRLFKLQLTRTDLEYFKNHKDEFSTSSLLSFIKIQAPLNNIQLNPIFYNTELLEKIDKFIIPGDRFYQEALLRDEALLKNTLEKMEKENKDIAVMITGGFHTEGITRLIEAKGLGYVVISPKITKVQEDNPYLSLMMDERLLSNTNTVEQDTISVPEYLAKTNELRMFLQGLDKIGEPFAKELINRIEALHRGEIKEGDSIKKIVEDIDKEIQRAKNSPTQNQTYINILTAIKDSISRKGHEEYHRAGDFKNVIESIAKELEIKPNDKGEYDFREYLKGKNIKRIETSHGEVRIEDEILIIIDSRFKRNHAGRKRLTVYAQNEAKAVHEKHELGLWIEHAKEKLHYTIEEIKGGELNKWIRNNIQEAKRLAKEFHNEAESKEQCFLSDWRCLIDWLTKYICINQKLPVDLSIDIIAGQLDLDPRYLRNPFNRLVNKVSQGSKQIDEKHIMEIAKEIVGIKEVISDLDRASFEKIVGEDLDITIASGRGPHKDGSGKASERDKRWNELYGKRNNWTDISDITKAHYQYSIIPKTERPALYNKIEDVLGNLWKMTGYDIKEAPQVFLLEADIPEGFLSNNNNIFISLGMLRIFMKYRNGEIRDEDIAFIIAHELGHYFQKKEGVTFDSRAVEHAAEYDADVRAIKLMNKAGYSTSGITEFFRFLKSFREDFNINKETRLRCDIQRCNELLKALRNKNYSHILQNRIYISIIANVISTAKYDYDLMIKMHMQEMQKGFSITMAQDDFREKLCSLTDNERNALIKGLLYYMEKLNEDLNSKKSEPIPFFESHPLEDRRIDNINSYIGKNYLRHYNKPFHPILQEVVVEIDRDSTVKINQKVLNRNNLTEIQKRIKTLINNNADTLDILFFLARLDATHLKDQDDSLYNFVYQQISSLNYLTPLQKDIFLFQLYVLFEKYKKNNENLPRPQIINSIEEFIRYIPPLPEDISQSALDDEYYKMDNYKIYEFMSRYNLWVINHIKSHLSTQDKSRFLTILIDRYESLYDNKIVRLPILEKYLDVIHICLSKLIESKTPIDESQLIRILKFSKKVDSTENIGPDINNLLYNQLLYNPDLIDIIKKAGVENCFMGLYSHKMEALYKVVNALSTKSFEVLALGTSCEDMIRNLFYLLVEREGATPWHKFMFYNDVIPKLYEKWEDRMSKTQYIILLTDFFTEKDIPPNIYSHIVHSLLFESDEIEEWRRDSGKPISSLHLYKGRKVEFTQWGNKISGWITGMVTYPYYTIFDISQNMGTKATIYSTSIDSIKVFGRKKDKDILYEEIRNDVLNNLLNGDKTQLEGLSNRAIELLFLLSHRIFIDVRSVLLEYFESMNDEEMVKVYKIIKEKFTDEMLERKKMVRINRDTLSKSSLEIPIPEPKTFHEYLTNIFIYIALRKKDRMHWEEKLYEIGKHFLGEVVSRSNVLEIMDCHMELTDLIMRTNMPADELITNPWDKYSPKQIKPMDIFSGRMQYDDFNVYIETRILPTLSDDGNWDSFVKEIDSLVPPSVFRNYLYYYYYFTYILMKMIPDLKKEDFLNYKKLSEEIGKLKDSERKIIMTKFKAMAPYLIKDEYILTLVKNRMAIYLAPDSHNDFNQLSTQSLSDLKQAHPDGDRWIPVWDEVSFYKEKSKDFEDLKYAEYGTKNNYVDLILAEMFREDLIRFINERDDLNEKLDEIASLFPRRSNTRDFYLDILYNKLKDGKFKECKLDQLERLADMMCSEERKNRVRLLCLQRKIDIYTSQNPGISNDELFRAELQMIVGKRDKNGELERDEQGRVIDEGYFPEMSEFRDDILRDLEWNTVSTEEQLQEVRRYYTFDYTIQTRKDIAEREEKRSNIIVIVRSLKVKEKQNLLLWLCGLNDEKPACIKKLEILSFSNWDSFREDNTLSTERYHRIGRTIRQKFIREIMFGGKESIIRMDPEENSKHNNAVIFAERFWNAITKKYNINSEESKKMLKMIKIILENMNDDPAKQLEIMTNIMMEFDQISKNKEFQEYTMYRKLGCLARVFLESTGLIGIKIAQYLAISSNFSLHKDFRKELLQLTERTKDMDKGSIFSILDELGIKNPVISKMLASASVKSVFILRGDPKVTKVKNLSVVYNIRRDIERMKSILAKFQEENLITKKQRQRLLREMMETIESDINFWWEKRNVERAQKSSSSRHPKKTHWFYKLIKFVSTMQGIDLDKYEIRYSSDVEVIDDIAMKESIAQGVSLKKIMQGEAVGYTEKEIKGIKRKINLETIRQIFEDGVLHADLHPGNIIVNREGEEKIIITIVDWGSVVMPAIPLTLDRDTVEDLIRKGLDETLLSTAYIKNKKGDRYFLKQISTLQENTIQSLLEFFKTQGLSDTQKTLEKLFLLKVIKKIIGISIDRMIDTSISKLPMSLKRSLDKLGYLFKDGNDIEVEGTGYTEIEENEELEFPESEEEGHSMGILPWLQDLFKRFGETKKYKLFLGPIIEELLYRGIPLAIAGLINMFSPFIATIGILCLTAITSTLFIMQHESGKRGPPTMVAIVASIFVAFPFVFSTSPIWLSIFAIPAHIEVNIIQYIRDLSKVEMTEDSAGPDETGGKDSTPPSRKMPPQVSATKSGDKADRKDRSVEEPNGKKDLLFASPDNPTYMAFCLLCGPGIDLREIDNPTYISTLARSFGVSEKNIKDALKKYKEVGSSGIINGTVSIIKKALQSPLASEREFFILNILSPFLTIVTVGYHIRGVENNIFKGFGEVFNPSGENPLEKFVRKFRKGIVDATTIVRLNQALKPYGFRVEVDRNYSIIYRITKKLEINSSGIGDILILERIGVSLLDSSKGKSTITDSDVTISEDLVRKEVQDIGSIVANNELPWKYSNIIINMWQELNIPLTPELAEGIIKSLYKRDFENCNPQEREVKIMHNIAVHECKHKWDENCGMVSRLSVDLEVSAYLAQIIYGKAPFEALVSLINYLEVLYLTTRIERIGHILQQAWGWAMDENLTEIGLRPNARETYEKYRCIMGDLYLPPLDGFEKEIVYRIDSFFKEGSSPDMRRGTTQVEHPEENKWIEERHLRGETLFIKRGKVYQIAFEKETGEPILDENGNYELIEVTDSEYNKIAKDWDEICKKITIDDLLDELGISTDRDIIKGEIAKRGLTLVIVKGYASVGILGDIFSHAGRGRLQITIGEYLLKQLMQQPDVDIQNVIKEELKHIIRDIYNQNNGKDRNTGQVHVGTQEEEKEGRGIYHPRKIIERLASIEMEAKRHALANMLGLQIDQIDEVLGADKYKLVQALINLIRTDGKITQDEIQIIKEQADVVEMVFKKVNIGVDSPVDKELKEKIAMFLAIRELEKLAEPKEPEFVRKLITTLEKKASKIGIDKDSIPNVIKHLCNEIDGFIEKDGVLHPTRYFVSFIELMEETFGITQEDLQQLITYKYIQAVTKKAFAIKGTESPVPSADINEIINRYVHYRDERYKAKAVDVLSLYLLEPGSVNVSKESKSNITNLINRKGLSSNINWTEEATDCINRNIVEEDKVNGEARRNMIQSLTRIRVSKMEKGDILSAYNNYCQGIIKELVDSEISNTTFTYDVTTIFGNLDNPLGLAMIPLIKKVQETEGKGNMNLFVTEKELPEEQKDDLINLLQRYNITVTKDQFTTVDNYYKKTHEGGKRVVAIMGESLNGKLTHKEGDRVLIANQEENDFMLLANMAIIAGSTKTMDEMKDKFRQLFRAYYKGSMGEDEISKWIDRISIEKGIIKIFLPPISPFVKPYYDALKGARELIQKSA